MRGKTLAASSSRRRREEEKKTGGGQGTAKEARERRELYGTLIRELGRNWHALTASKLKYISATVEGRCAARGNPREIPGGEMKGRRGRGNFL